MRKNLLLFVSLFFGHSARLQVNQVTIGASNVTLVFNAVKYDPNDGGTINVGYINDPVTGTGNDCFIVKLNGSQQIVWQKIISNVGDDYLNQVIICANGDYMAVGQLTQGGIIRGVACRIDKTNGNIIWSSVTSNSPIGEKFYDVVETANGNIAISGTDSYSPSLTNVFIVLLNSSGGNIWSRLSSYGDSDEPLTINQLPNGNLIIGAFQWVGFYNAIIIELDEMTGGTISENSYTISGTMPNSGIVLNSIWPTSIKIKNGVVTFNVGAFQGTTSASSMCIYTYDQGTKVLSGNIYYHTGDINAIAYTYSALGANDFLIAQSFTTPNRVYISRVTNGVVAYDDLINDQVISINGLDTTGINAAYVGRATYNTFTNTYNLFSSRNDPATTSLCSITASNTLALLPSTLNPTGTGVISLSPSIPLNALSLASQTSTYTLNTICGAVLPLTLINFSAFYNSSSNTTQLKWSTTNEFNSKAYIIERSVDNGVNFIPMGSVNAHGSTNSATNYDFNDYSPAKGRDLYRLKELDIDNKVQYSNVVAITVNSHTLNRYYLSPNPANNYTLINSNSSQNKIINIGLFDALGKLVKKDVVEIDNNHPYRLSINNLHGIYYVKIQCDNELEALKLVIE